MTGSALGWLQRLFRTLAGSEVLDELPEPAVDRRRESFFGLLMGPEILPTDEEPIDNSRKSLLRLLFSSEDLPADEAPGPGPQNSAVRQGRGRAR